MKVIKDYSNNEKIFGFLKIEPLRAFEVLEHYLDKNKVVATNINSSIEQFLNQLKTHEDKCKRDFKFKDNGEKYEHRYGYIFDCLLPKGNYEEYEIKSIVSKFFKYVTGKEKGLRYIAFKIIKGEAIYLKIYITDREYYFHKKVHKYTRNIYVHKNKHHFVSKNHELAILKNKKGDVKLDELGNPIYETLNFKETKSRVFIYSENQKETFKDTLLTLFIQAVKKVKTKVEIVFGKFFKRMNLSKAYNRFLRRIIIANNLTMQEIQNTLNAKIRSRYRYINEYEAYKLGVTTSEIIATKQMGVYIELFTKYQEIFRKGMFEINAIKYKIKNERCDEVEKNLIKLKRMFEKEFNQL